MISRSTNAVASDLAHYVTIGPDGETGDRADGLTKCLSVCLSAGRKKADLSEDVFAQLIGE